MTATATRAETNGKATDEQKEIVARAVRMDDLRAKDWRVDLLDGQWAKMRDPATVTEGQRRHLKEARATIEAWDHQIDRQLQANNFAAVKMMVEQQATAAAASENVIVALVVESWSFDFGVPQPHDPAPVRLLIADDYDTLLKVAYDIVKSTRVNPETTSMGDDSPFQEPADSNPPS